ncbi:MAG: Uma2 family endonuclease [Leptolyngbya sp. SIOISBB]|nr:Uma2 family endonuclease [Leptolyngbya sp. SIOISBB]
MTLTTAKWTVDDYHQMAVSGILAGRRVELLQGDIVEMAPEGPEHAYLADDASKYLTQLLGDRAQVRDSKLITLAPDSEPEPDIAIVRSLGTVYRQRHPYPEDVFWLIEFAQSSLVKDLKPKRATYAIVGIPEYWVVNLKARQVVVLCDPAAGDYQSEQILQSGTIAPQAFANVAVSISRLLGQSHN